MGGITGAGGRTGLGEGIGLLGVGGVGGPTGAGIVGGVTGIGITGATVQARTATGVGGLTAAKAGGSGDPGRGDALGRTVGNARA